MICKKILMLFMNKLCNNLRILKTRIEVQKKKICLPLVDSVRLICEKVE